MVACVALGFVSCGGGPSETGSLAADLPQGEPQPADAQHSTQTVRLTSRSLRDPALFLGPGADAAAVGYVGDAATVVVTGAPQAGRLPVKIAGGVEFEGWLDARALAAVVQRRGKVKGAPVYLAPGDEVRVEKIRADGLSEISVIPRSEVLARSGTVLGPYKGVFPTVGLGSEVPRGAEPPRPGSWHQVAAGSQVQVFDRPSGNVIAVLSQLQEPLVFAVLRDGDWKGVRIGQGPFLVGFINAKTTAVAAAPKPSPKPSKSSGGVPSRLEVDRERALWRIKPGTSLAHGQTRFATLSEPGYAREMGRFEDGMVDVFVAVDDSLAVRGLVSGGALEKLNEPAKPAAQPSKPVTSPALPPPSSPNLSPTGGVPSPPQ